jgi:two-component system sensor histidine kinase MprB
LESLDTARRSQDQLIADASHELRTPLTALRANVELLASGVDIDPAERAQMATDLSSQLDQFGELIGGLVELARGDKPPEHFQSLRLDDLVSDSVARARALWPGATFTLSSSETTVMGDRDQLERAVRNLLDNAARYAGDAGPIDVHVEAGEVSVRDRGPGVPEDERTRIFERFHRGAGARAVSGSGLGLAIVAQIARAHGGAATVDGADGGGACFRLRLPVSPDTASRVAASSAG